MIRAIIALLASALTAVQAFSIFIKGQTFCFNSGCAIVDSLTTISSLYFNLAGFLYFQILFWCLLWGREGSENWHKIARLLLLAGLCAEAVLVFFQYAIATVFCSYCLVILSFIVLLNILSGPRQIMRGIVLFSAVTIACFALQFRAAGGSGLPLEAGTMAMIAKEKKDTELYLFFSSTCPHCEKIIESLREENTCNVRFNPVDRMDDFSFTGSESFTEYNPEVNLNFLKSLSITEIPVLVASEKNSTLVLRGKQRILEYLEDNCRETKVIDYGGTSSVGPADYTVLPGMESLGDDSCTVAVDCDPQVPNEAEEKE